MTVHTACCAFRTMVLMIIQRLENGKDKHEQLCRSENRRSEGTGARAEYEVERIV